MNAIHDLPVGIYAVGDEFLEKEGEVTLTFRGTTYRAVVGQTAFAHFGEMTQAAQAVPTEPFCGQSFDTPVAIVTTGGYTCPANRAFLPITLSRAIAILGEGMGISPNEAHDLSKPSLARGKQESSLNGSLYFGTLTLHDGVEGTLTLDGLTLNGIRVMDKRTTGKDLNVIVRNCIISGAHHACIVGTDSLADADSTRTVLVSNCRCDGFDSLERQGRFVGVCATHLAVERVYFANTKEFFGLTTYDREMNNCPPGDASITLRDCVLEHYEGPRAVAVQLPDNASARVCVERCVLRDFGDADTPVFHVNLPNERCCLTLRDVSISSTKGQKLAVLLDGCKSAPVIFENVTLDGVSTLSQFQPPRRTQAPEYIGEVVWSADRLDDPHTPCTDPEVAENALRQLNAMYADRKAMHGDMHTHTNSGGTSDGKTPLGEFVKQLKSLGLDFAAVVDHKQISHCFLPEWDDMLICGTEPGMTLNDPSRPLRSCKMHYCMLFQHPSDYFRVMDAFPEFNFTGGQDGHNSYPNMTPERVAELSRFIYSLGGLMVHAHPKQLMASDEPLHYYFGQYMPLESILGHANSLDTVQNRNLWESLLKLGKRVHTHGDSDTHAQAKNCSLTTVYAREANGAAILREVREGDCAAGSIGVKMAICGTRMGGHLPYRNGLILAIRLEDYYAPAMLKDTVYCLKVYTDQGLAYASEFDGTKPQQLTIPVQKRRYYRVEVTNESDGFFVSISNPIWLDEQL